MNFDQLKDEWNETNGSEPNISDKILTISSAKTPIDKIRKKMKTEFLGQVISFFILVFSPYFLGFSSELKAVFYIFYVASLAFTCYYSYRFYRFYRHSYQLELDSRKNLLWFYYEMRLNIEMYKALNYILSFIGLSFLFVVLFMYKDNHWSQILAKISKPYILINCFISILIVGLITEAWAKFYYGKYTRQIKTLIDKLDEE